MYRSVVAAVLSSVARTEVFLERVQAFLAQNEYKTEHVIGYRQAKPPIIETIQFLTAGGSGNDTNVAGLAQLAELVYAETILPLQPERALAVVANVRRRGGVGTEISRLYERIEKLVESRADGDVTLDLVIVFCDEDLAWVSDIFGNAERFVNIYIMSKCGQAQVARRLLEKYAKVTLDELPNVGQESIGYTHYILRHLQASQASHALLVHGNPFSHTDRTYLKLMAAIYLNGFLANVPFLHLSNRRFLAGSSFCLRDLQYNTMGFVDPVLGSYCCSQFLVRKDRLAAATSAATSLHQFMLGNTDQLKCSQKRIEGHLPGHHISQALENLWPRVLGEDRVLPARENDNRLPLVLRNEMLSDADRRTLEYFSFDL